MYKIISSITFNHHSFVLLIISLGCAHTAVCMDPMAKYDNENLKILVATHLLDDAVNEQNCLKAKQAILRKANINYPMYPMQETFLHRAIWIANIDIVQLLIEHGANVNAKSSYQNTPLHWAVHIPPNLFRPAIVQLLVSNGADILAKNNKGLTPYDYTFQDNNQEALTIFSQALRKDRN